jgi:hypothetical protein
MYLMMSKEGSFGSLEIIFGILLEKSKITIDLFYDG